MNDTGKNKNYEQQTFIVPCDMMLEIAQIILQADLPHEIVGVKENKRQVVICISCQGNLKFHQQAIENIEAVLKDYHDLCSEESKTVNWRE